MFLADKFAALQHAQQDFAPLPSPDFSQVISVDDYFDFLKSHNFESVGYFEKGKFQNKAGWDKLDTEFHESLEIFSRPDGLLIAASYYESTLANEKLLTQWESNESLADATVFISDIHSAHLAASQDKKPFFYLSGPASGKPLAHTNAIHTIPLIQLHGKFNTPWKTPENTEADNQVTLRYKMHLEQMLLSSYDRYSILPGAPAETAKNLNNARFAALPDWTLEMVRVRIVGGSLSAAVGSPAPNS